MPRILVYGASGYTGALVAHRATERGLELLLTGRREAPLAALGRELGQPHVAFPLEDAAALDAAFARCDLVLHCAGPFRHTWRPIAGACLRHRRHYVDITGEPPVIAGLEDLGPRAETAGIVLLPAAGFDVVPSDTLAVHLQRRLPSATRIAVGMHGFGSISRGTARTTVESLLEAPAREPRKQGARAPTIRSFRFADGERSAIRIPAADAASMRRSTRIADCSYYMALSRAVRFALPLALVAAPLRPALRAPSVRDALAWAVTRGRAGPSPDELARGRVELVGVAEDDAGSQVSTTLTVPHAYAFTALSAVEIAERLLRAPPPPGFHTPSSAFGPDLLVGLPGVSRVDH